MGLRLQMLLLLAVALPVQAQEFREGTDFVRIAQPAFTADPARVQVEEFFWYGCPHCYALEPALEKWVERKPADVDFVRVPHSLGREVGFIHSKAWYTQQLLGLAPQVHRALFDAIHQEHRSLDTLADVTAFIAEHGGRPRAEVDAAINGFMVDNQVRQAEDLARQYSITGTPAVVVGGRYGVKAGESAHMLATVDYLVERVRREQQGLEAGKPAVMAGRSVAPRPEPAASGEPVAEKPMPLGAFAAIGIVLLLGGAAWMARRKP